MNLLYPIIFLLGTLVRSGTADPCLLFEDGKYYLTMTGSRNVAVISAGSIDSLSSSAHPLKTEDLVYRSEEDGVEVNGTWSPEIHFISDTDCPGHSGWYLYFALRAKHIENGRVMSDRVRMVALKSASGSPAGPYVHPVGGEISRSQPILDRDGQPYKRWACGFSLLRIPSGRHAGLYGMWVEEAGRGKGFGNFYQKIMIARMKSPWQMAELPSEITHPTQDWEKVGASSRLPMVVEGATAVYGDHGEIFLIYCGGGYWADYGLGQMTLLRDGNDYADPVRSESWLKFEGNPIFSSSGSPDARGAGHAFFFRDADGRRMACYHAYPVVDGVKGKRRNAYLVTCDIDYSATERSAPYGLLRF